MILENIQLDPAMQRLRNALSECENDNESGTFTPAKPHLSPVLEDPQRYHNSMTFSIIYVFQ